MKDGYKNTPPVWNCQRLSADEKIPTEVGFQHFYLCLAPLFIIWIISPLDIFPEALLGPFVLPDDTILVVTLFLLVRLALSFYSEKKIPA